MFVWVGAQFDNVLGTYVLGVISRLMAGIAPVALTGMTLWVGMYGWAVMRNEVAETLPNFLWKVFKLGLILAISLQSGLYVSSVSETANGLASGVAATFIPSAAKPLITSAPYEILDSFNDGASQLVLDLLRDAGITRLDLLFAAIVTAFGNVIFLCLALFIVTLAKVVLTFTIAVGPLFVLCLAWRPTARFFDSWLSMLLNAVVLTWFAFFALGLSAYLGTTLVKVIQEQGGFQGPTFNVVAESLKYCIVMVLMAIVCFQAPSLASALTGGVAVQQGLQMVQNVLNVSGVHYRSRQASLGARGGARAAAASTVGRTAAYRQAARRGGL